MNLTKHKRLIAKEWLIFLIAIIGGLFFSLFFYFKDTSNYQSKRDYLYISLKYEYQKTKHNLDIPELKNLKLRFHHDKIFWNDSSFVIYLATKYPDEFGYLPSKIKKSDSTFSYISYAKFIMLLENHSSRKMFYDTCSVRDELPDYESFEKEYNPETLYSRLSRLQDKLFNSHYWKNTFFSLLMPYIIVLLLRSIYFSIKILFKNKKSP